MNNNSDKYKIMRKNRYDKLKEVIIECPFCGYRFNLNNYTFHINRKKCINSQKTIYNNFELNIKKVNLNKYINKLRYDALKNIDNSLLE